MSRILRPSESVSVGFDDNIYHISETHLLLYQISIWDVGIKAGGLWEYDLYGSLDLC